MAIGELRPLGVGEIMDTAIAVYRAQFRTLLGVAASCAGPGAMLSVYTEMAGGAEQHPFAFLGAMVLAGAGFLMLGAGTVHVISEFYLGREILIGDALGVAWDHLWKLVLVGTASSLLVGLSFLALVVPGIIVACGYAVATQVVVLEERRKTMAALSRSWNLTRGFKWKVFQLGVIVFVLVQLPQFAASVMMQAASPWREVGIVGSSLASLLLQPVATCALTLLYYDLRVRKEGLDLEVMAQRAGADASGA